MIKRIYNVLKHWMGFSWYFQNRFQAIPTHHTPVKQHAKRRVVKSCDWILRHRCSIPPCKYMWSTCELTGLHKGTEITTFEVHSWRNSTVSIKHCSTKFDVDIWRLGAHTQVEYVHCVCVSVPDMYAGPRPAPCVPDIHLYWIFYNRTYPTTVAKGP